MQKQTSNLFWIKFRIEKKDTKEHVKEILRTENYQEYFMSEGRALASAKWLCTYVKGEEGEGIKRF